MAVRRITTLQGPTLKADDGTTAATIADSTGQITVGSGSNSYKLPIVRAAENNYVLAMTDKTNGTTGWNVTATAPTINDISGSLNHDQDSTLTLFGADFSPNTTVSLWDASTSGNKVGSDATITNQTTTKLEATFGHGDLNVGATLYAEASNSGITTRFATAFVVSADPTVTFTQGTGSGANTTNHFGTYGGRVAGGGQDSNTKLLLNFDRTGGTDIEDSSNTGGDGHKITASGNAVIKASPFRDGKSAMFFDGTDDKLTITDSDDFAFGSGDFTFECWVYASSFSSDNEIFADHNSSGSYQTFSFGMTSSQKLKFVFVPSSGSNVQVLSDAVFSTNTWYHVASVRNGNTITNYVDGVSVATGSVTGLSMATATVNPTIGKAGDYNGSYLDGYLDEIRIVKGTAVYTSDFTVPTSRLTAITNTKLLIHSNRTDEGNTTFTDSSSDSPANNTAHTITRTGAIHSKLHGGIAPAMTWPASQKKTGSAGVYFDGNDNLDLDAAVGPSGAGARSIEAFVYQTQSSSGDYQYLWSYGEDTPAKHFGASILHGGYLRFQGHGSADFNTTATQSSFLNNWKHVASTYDGTTVRMFVDGTEVGSSTHTLNTSDTSGTGDNLHIGYSIYSASGHYFNGYIDGFRVSNIARHVNNSGTYTYPVPTQIYGAYKSKTIPTITFTGQLASGSLASDEDIEFSNVANTSITSGMQKLDDSKIGLTLTNLTGGNKNKAELTGTISDNFSGTTRANLPVKAQVRTERGSASGTSGQATITFGSGINTEGLQPGYYILTGSATNAVTEVTLTGASYNNGTTVTFGSSVTSDIAVGMVVFGKGIPNGTTVSTIDSGTQITLSASTTDGSLSSQSLTFTNVIKSIDSATQITVTKVHSGTVSGTIYFGDPERVAIVNGNPTSTASDAIVMGTSDPMLTIAIDSDTQPTLFSARRYVGTGAERDINGFGFQPDLVWFKNRDTVDTHALFDSVRGATYRIRSDDTQGNTQITEGLKSFDSDGFTVGNNNGVNYDTKAQIAWAWKAGGAPSGTLGTIDSTTTSGAGTISSSSDSGYSLISNATNVTQSVNRDSGFSITKFTGHDSGCAFPHNLGDTPAFLVIKSLVNSGTTDGWYAWHQNQGTLTGNSLFLNTNDDLTANSGVFSTAPSTVITTGSADGSGGFAGAFICYAFKAVSGVSAFGSYSGTGSAGNNKSIGFVPSFLMIKKTNGDASWMMMTNTLFAGTTTTSGVHYNDADHRTLYADLSGAESSGTHSSVRTYVSGGNKGFELYSSNTETNASGGTYIYMAFA